MQSSYSSGTENRKGYDQVLRTISCMCETVKQGSLWQWPHIEFNEFLTKFDHIAFYSIFPEDKSGKIDNLLFNNKDSIKRRMCCILEKEKKKDYIEYYNKYFLPFLEKIWINIITWEEIIKFIQYNDEKYGDSLIKFYDYCKKYN